MVQFKVEAAIGALVTQSLQSFDGLMQHMAASSEGKLSGRSL